MRNPTLADRLRDLLNEESRENESDTPDFILAEYLLAALVAFEQATNAREEWHGRARGEGVG